MWTIWTSILFFNDTKYNLFENIIKSKVNFKRYWDITLYNNSTNYFNENIILDNIRNIFEESVKIRLNSDRPIGALLSGGLDSSIICAIASKF